jgi:hypothetical protein
MSTTPNPMMSGSPGGEPISNPPQQRGFFSKIGQFLKTAACLTAVLGNLRSVHLSYSPALSHCNTFPAGRGAALSVAAKQTSSASLSAAQAASYPDPIPERPCRSATS